MAERESPLAGSLAMVVVVLMALGTVFVYSASANVNAELDLDHFYRAASARRIVIFPLACSILYLTSCINYRRLSLENGILRSPITYMLVLSIALLIMVLVIGTTVNRATRWIRIPIGPATISFQPSELAKWSIIIFLAGICTHVGSDIRQFRRRFVPICAVVGLVVALVLVEDLGTAAFISLVAFLMLILAGARWWHVTMPLPFGAAAFAFALMHSPGRLERIKAFLEPEKWADTTAYQANQSLIALGSGGVWGKGLGRGICKYGHLPEDTTDFIFAIIGEELGFAGTAAVIGLFIAFVCLGLAVVLRCRDPFGRLLAIGITLAVAIQAALNIGVVTVVLPTKGIPLPFISAGGTSMLVSAAAVGVLLNIAKQTATERADKSSRR